MSILYTILLIISSTFLYPAFGAEIGSLLSRTPLFRKTELDYGQTWRFSAPCLSLLWVLGCISHLYLTYVIYRCSIPLHYSVLLSFILLSYFSKNSISILWKEALRFRISQWIPSIDFSFYIFIVMGIGISQTSFSNGLTTIWTNNYSDLPFHLGIIQGYRFGEIPLTDYPMYPGIKLSYYILPDFWAACLASLSENDRILQLVFNYQWLMCCLLLYVALSQKGLRMLPYAVLFGGGSWPILFKQLTAIFSGSDPFNSLSHVFIEKDFPLTVFLSTIWIPQKAAFVGVTFLVTIISHFVWAERARVNPLTQRTWPLATLIPICMSMLSACLLVHTHSALIGIAFILLVLSFKLFKSKSTFHLWLPYIKRVAFLMIIFGIIPIAILSGKSSLLKFSIGWMPWGTTSGYNPSDYTLGVFYKIYGSLRMWFWNLGFPSMFFFSLLLLRSRARISISLFLIFLVCNLVQIGVWDWDQYKFFIALFAVSMCCTTLLQTRRLFLNFMALLLCVPGIIESGLVFFQGRDITVYSEEELYDARSIRNNTPPDSIVATLDNHKSTIFLAGRKTFLGYPGWLSSHGIDYQSRSRLNSLVIRGYCSELKYSDVIPNYVQLRRFPPGHPRYSHPAGLVKIEDACAFR